jgi:hypothetical protein
LDRRRVSWVYGDGSCEDIVEDHVIRMRENHEFWREGVKTAKVYAAFLLEYGKIL